VILDGGAEGAAEVAPLCLLRLPQVSARVGLRRTSIYSLVKSGAFPQPIKLGRRCVAWPSDEIDLWVRARIAETRPVDRAPVATLIAEARR
jgi:prophage regulatory protein